MGTDAEWSQAVGLPAESGATPEDKDSKIADVYPWGAGYPPPKGSGNYSGEGDVWSGKIDDYADGPKFTAKVGSYTANGFGIHDLGGNVWEWCADYWGTNWDTASTPIDPVGPAQGENRVIRGGSFLCHYSYCNRYRVAARSKNTPDSSSSHTGFRCVADVA